MSKYCYEENELVIADSQCSLCEKYKDGERSEICPAELIDDIMAGKVRCPFFSRHNVLSQLTEKQPVNRMITQIYKGTGWFSKTQIGMCEDGTIYSGYGWGRNCVGSYYDGAVFSGYGWGKTQIGCYQNGSVYYGTGWGKTLVGSYENGAIYSGTGFLSKSQVGSYDGVDGGAAAAALLLLLGK